MQLGRLAARAVIGGLFVGHGLQKLTGAFGGPGLAGTQSMMDAIGMRPAKANALAAGVTETAGGALLAAGLATPAAAAGLIGTMATAVRKVHLKNGVWVSNGGYEYNVVLIAALLALVDGGPGDLSLDRLVGFHDTDHKWALAALGTGLAASALAVELGRRGASAEPAYPADEDTASTSQPTEPTEPAKAAQSDVGGDPVTSEA